MKFLVHYITRWYPPDCYFEGTKIVEADNAAQAEAMVLDSLNEEHYGYKFEITSCVRYSLI